MKKARLTEEQIIGVLQEHGAGEKRTDRCRKHGMTESTFYAGKAKYSGMAVSEAKRLTALEDENAKLKKMLAEQILDMLAMRELLRKNGNARREARGCSASEGPSRAVGTVGVRDCGRGPQDGEHSVLGW